MPPRIQTPLQSQNPSRSHNNICTPLTLRIQNILFSCLRFPLRKENILKIFIFRCNFLSWMWEDQQLNTWLTQDALLAANFRHFIRFHWNDWFMLFRILFLGNKNTFSTNFSQQIKWHWLLSNTNVKCVDFVALALFFLRRIRIVRLET